MIIEDASSKWITIFLAYLSLLFFQIHLRWQRNKLGKSLVSITKKDSMHTYYDGEPHFEISCQKKMYQSLFEKKQFQMTNVREILYPSLLVHCDAQTPNETPN
jgi:hypothetical protein